MNPQQGMQHLGKYELRERLGRGGMAEVWKAFDTQLHRHVAIKLLHADLQTDPEFITRFSREARVIASLHHPNIVQIHDFQTTHPPELNAYIAYMVMEYIEGQTLAHYIRSTSRAGKFPPPIDIVHLFTSISKAIDYAHQEGMIHRDIKPANILLDKRNTKHTPMGEPVLTDFGIAKLMGATSGTMSGMWLGTPLYISPEQAQGQSGNKRSDLYSLGVILYEICTGVQPFSGESAAAIMAQHINSMPISPALINPYISPALAMVILHAMAKDPVARFSSASAMTAAVAEAFNLPVPADLPLPAVPIDTMNEPTYLSPRGPNLSSSIMPPGVLSSPPVAPVLGSTPQTSSMFLMTPPSAMYADSGPDPLAKPIDSATVLSSPLIAAQNAQPAAPSLLSSGTLPPAPPSPSTSMPWRGRKRLFIALFVILILLAGSSIGALFTFSGTHTSPTTVTASPVVGDVIFLNSGQLNAQNSQGVDDEVQVDLHNIPNPDAGKSYYGWLKNASIAAEGTWTFLGNLQVNKGNAQLPSPYQDMQHSDLLLNASSFLVTEEDSNVPPTQPSTNHSTWRYYSEPPAITLLHLRHLLAKSPELDIRQLYGGMGIWFWRNTEKILEWASAARDDPSNTALLRRQLIRILDYIDGVGSVSMDVPPNTPVLVSPIDAQIPLVGPAPHLEAPGSLYNGKGEVPPGYVYLIRVHLDAAVSVPQATAKQRQLASQIDSALDLVKLDLEQVRQDARRLLTVNSRQLATPQAQSTLNDLATAAQNAYGGSINLGQAQKGANWIYTNLQLMATFDVKPNTAK
jgi:eukaryotic-like serine/threonine-protein kinase